MKNFTKQRICIQETSKLLLLVLFSFTISNCARDLSQNPIPTGSKKTDGNDTQGGVGPYYDPEVKAMFTQYCKTCHNSNAPLPDWMDYSTAAGKKELIKKRVADGTMPPAGMPAPTNAEKDIIIAWVDNGAPERAAGTAPTPTPEPSPTPTPDPNPPTNPPTEPTPPSDPTQPPTPELIGYNQHAKPIFQKVCGACHGPNNAFKIPDWLDYQTAFNKKDVIKKRLSDGTMPIPATAITAEEKAILVAWVDGGGLLDAPETPTPTPVPPTEPPPTEPIPQPTPPPHVSYTADILPIFQAKCLTCHGPTDSVNKDKPDLGTYSEAFKYRYKIYERVIVEGDKMKYLNNNEAILIKSWVEVGAPEF